VDGFVFWTKNLRPFSPNLAEIRARGFPFMIQYGINGYPRELEASVIDPRAAVALLRDIRATFGPRVCVWRYDTIIISSLTPIEWHLRNFESLARELQGATDEAVISFLHPYKKTVRALDAASKARGFDWRDPTTDEKKDLASRMVGIAGQYGIRLSICAQREYLIPGAWDARCVDADRLSDIAGHAISAGRQGHRKECGCYESRDIGEYDTCPHGCVYCYAVSDRELARKRLRGHDPQSEFLYERLTP
jgi:hypothetical protein